METEKRLIDANALLVEIEKVYADHYEQSAYQFIHDFVNAIRRRIRRASTVDAVEVVHGRWEPREDVKGFVCCSVCHDCNIYDEWPDGKKWNYCPNCGADMRERK